MIISLIAAIDEKQGLGKENHLLCHLPADLKHFKELTIGKPIVMGRKTYDSIGKPLPGRQNIVLSRYKSSIEGVTIIRALQDALQFLSDASEIMIIGGANLFEQTMPMAHRIYLTRIHHTFDADTFFPILDETIWYCQESIFRSKDEKNAYDMTFCRYDRKAS